MEKIELINEMVSELEALKAICNSFQLNSLSRKIDEISETEIQNFPYQFEKNIYELYLELRKNILDKSCFTDTIKSPNIKDSLLNYDYERGFAPSILEDKINYKQRSQGAETIIFRSAMSAIDSILKVLVRIFDMSQFSMLDGSFYFETGQLFHNFYNRLIPMHSCNSYDSIYRELEHKNYNLIFVEILNINSPDSVLDLDILIKKLNLYKGFIVIIIDTTACGYLFDRERLLSLINRKVLLFEVNSGIKLMQLGLELSNVGYLKIASNSDVIGIEKIKSDLVAFRALTGTSILPFEEEILCNDVFFSDLPIRYVKKLEKVCRNCYEVMKINSNLEINFGESSVFLIIKLKNGGYIQYTEFLYELNKYLRIKNLDIIVGTSFGFRHPRIEIIDSGKENFYFRLSTGCYEGPLIYEICNFFRSWRS